MAAAADIYPFVNPLLNALVDALVDFKSGARDPLRLPPLPIPKRKRSHQINLQGVRDAKRHRQEEEAKKAASATLVPHCNANGDGGRSAGRKTTQTKTEAKKKASSAASKRAWKDPVPELPKFVMHEVGHLKLVIRKVTENGTCDKEEADRNHKRKVDGAGLTEEDMSRTKKVKLMSESPPELMNTDLAQSEVAEACASSSSAAQRAPFNPMYRK